MEEIGAASASYHDLCSNLTNLVGRGEGTHESSRSLGYWLSLSLSTCLSSVILLFSLFIFLFFLVFLAPQSGIHHRPLTLIMFYCLISLRRKHLLLVPVPPADNLLPPSPSTLTHDHCFCIPLTPLCSTWVVKILQINVLISWLSDETLVGN